MPEQLERRNRDARRIEFSKPSLRHGVALRLAERASEDDTLTEQEKMQVYQGLPRNRAEARRLLRGRGPWGLAKRNG